MPVHVVQRGNNRQVCFAKEVDMAAYANWLGEYAKKFDVEVHGWVFMTNHVHLLLTPKDEAGVSRLMQTLGRLYVRYFNYGYQRTTYFIWRKGLGFSFTREYPRQGYGFSC
jgi:putative transposase